MKSLNRFLGCLSLGLGLLSGFALGAPAKPKLPDDRTVITSIDLTKHTLELTHMSHGIKTDYILAPDIVVQINGKAATVKALKVGMAMHLLTLGTGMDDPPVIEEIDIGK